MSVLLLPDRFKKQPQYPAPIDRSGIGERARFVLIGAQPKAIITGTPRTGTVGASAATLGGIAYVLPPAVSTWAVRIADLDPLIAGSFSVFWYGVMRDNSSQRLIRSANPANSVGWSIAAETSPAGTIKLSLFDVWSGVIVRSGNIPITDNSIHSASISYDASAKSVEFFFDGASESTSTWEHSAQTTGDSQTFSMFTPDAKAFKMLTVQAYAGKLSARDARSLSDNPWQIFKAPPRRLVTSSSLPPSSALHRMFAVF